MNGTEVLVAIISAFGLIVVALVNAFVFLRINEIKRNVTKVEVATNSMKDELVRLTHIEGVAEGRRQIREEQAGKE